jgi:CHASE2 domain-containing sensor protein
MAIPHRYKNVVMAISLDAATNAPAEGYLQYDTPNLAYTNFTMDNQHVVREFDPFVTLGGKQYTSFAAAVVKIARPGAYDTLDNEYHDRQVINYDYKLINYQLQTADAILKDTLLKPSIAGKIVLVGYVSDNKYDCNDKHWTPLKSTIADKTLPDLNGIVIHADIIRMIMYQKYIHKVHWFFVWLIAFVICWVHMAFFIGYFIEKHTWFHLAAKIAQLISAMIFIYLGFFLFFYLHWLIDMTTAILAIVLAVDVLYFYEAGVLWFHQRKGYKTLFHHEEHH